MEQRRLRLGDILDDYCPRERRVTNHVLVAMIEEDIKQTRCTTCDAEHAYKGGRAPRRKKAESTSALYKEVLATVTEENPHIDMQPRREPEPEPIEPEIEPEPPRVEAVAEIVDAGIVDIDIVEDDGEDPPPPSADEGFHRPLIRAQLPRPEGLKLERQAPDFTIRQANGNGSGRGHGSSFRGSDMRGRGGRQGGSNGSGGGSHQGAPRFGRGPHRGRGGQNQQGNGNGFGRKRGR